MTDHDEDARGEPGQAAPRAHGEPTHVEAPALSAEPPLRRVRQYAFMVACAMLVVVFGVWLVWSWASQREQAQEQAQAAKNYCRQLVGLGQNCQAAPGEREGVSNQAAVPAPTGSLSGDPVAPSRSPGAPAPTDENGVPLAYSPGEGALITAVGVEAGRLVLTFDDGARLDAGPVNEQTLAIVLKQVPAASPSPVPSPAPAPSREGPPGADAPDPPADSTASPTTEETR